MFKQLWIKLLLVISIKLVIKVYFYKLNCNDVSFYQGINIISEENND